MNPRPCDDPEPLSPSSEFLYSTGPFIRWTSPYSNQLEQGQAEEPGPCFWKEVQHGQESLHLAYCGSDRCTADRTHDAVQLADGEPGCQARGNGYGRAGAVLRSQPDAFAQPVGGKEDHLRQRVERGDRRARGK